MILLRVLEGDHQINHKIEDFPCLIGRSLECGVQIDDPSVSARHVEITENSEGYLLRDLASTNGVIANGERVTQLQLGAKERVFLGDVRLDIICSSILDKTRITQMLPEDFIEAQKTTPLRLGFVLLASFVAVLLLALAETYQIFWPPEHPSELIMTAVLRWLQLVGIGLVLSVLCKVHAKRACLHQTIALSACGFNGVRAFKLILPSLVFNLHNFTAAPYLSPTGLALILFFLLMRLQRYLIRRNSRLQKLALAGGIAFLTALALEIGGDGRNPSEPTRITPIGLNLGRALNLSRTPDDLVVDLSLTFKAIDKQRKADLEKLESEAASNR